MTRFSLIVLLFFDLVLLRAQKSDVQIRINNGELKMNYPGIYFKHNSTEYAVMPYSVDSCFKYIATHIEEIKSYVVWRDSSEAESLTGKRIKKLKAELRSRGLPASIHLESMSGAQKISRRSINQAETPAQKQFLLSLNSVFEVSATRLRNPPYVKKICWNCIFAGRKCQTNRLFVKRLFGH